MSSVVYDAGALIAADRDDPKLWADHRVLLECGVTPWTTAPVLAQVSRSAEQVRLRRFLRGCHIASFESQQAHTVGALLAASGTTDVVDAHVIVTAAAHTGTVLTSDPDDLQRLSQKLSAPVNVKRI
jgi:PIN domain